MAVHCSLSWGVTPLLSTGRAQFHSPTFRAQLPAGRLLQRRLPSAPLYPVILPPICQVKMVRSQEGPLPWLPQENKRNGGCYPATGVDSALPGKPVNEATSSPALFVWGADTGSSSPVTVFPPRVWERSLRCASPGLAERDSHVHAIQISNPTLGTSVPGHTRGHTHPQPTNTDAHLPSLPPSLLK